MTNKMNADEVTAMILRPPFHQWLGLRLLRLEEDGLTIGVPWREEFVANPTSRHTHGGILAALVDLAGDYAVAVKLGRPVPTVDMRVDYHRPAKPGDLTVSARVLRLGRIVATAEASVSDSEGALVASGRGVYLTTDGMPPSPAAKAI